MIHEKQNFLSANWIAPVDSIRNIFRLIGSSFVWLGKLGEQTAQLWWDNSRCVRTHENLFTDWAQQYNAFFVPNQEPVFAWLFGNGPVRVSTQGLFRQCLKTFVAPFLPAQLTAPGAPRMINNKTTDFFTFCSTYIIFVQHEITYKNPFKLDNWSCSYYKCHRFPKN